MSSFVSTPTNNGGGMAEFTVGAPCGAAGGAMYDIPSHDPNKFPTGAHCFLIAAPPVIIGDTYMSMEQGFKHVNFIFRVNGYQPACPNCIALPEVG